MPTQQRITPCIVAQSLSIARYSILTDTIFTTVDGRRTEAPGFRIVEATTTGGGVGTPSFTRPDKELPIDWRAKTFAEAALGFERVLELVGVIAGLDVDSHSAG